MPFVYQESYVFFLVVNFKPQLYFQVTKLKVMIIGKDTEF